MNDMKDYLWLLQTDKGDFFISVFGNWTQEEAAKKARTVFDSIGVNITAMIPRKRATGPDETMCTLYEQKDAKSGLGFDFLAGKRLWEACGRGVEYEAELIRSKKEIGGGTK